MNAYYDGYNAGRRGETKNNPYFTSLEPTNHAEWYRGWETGRNSRTSHPIPTWRRRGSQYLHPIPKKN